MMKALCVLALIVGGCRQAETKVSIDRIHAMRTGADAFALVNVSSAGERELWRIDQSGKPVWKRTAGCDSTGTFAANDDVVVVRCARLNGEKGVDALTAFKASDGTQQWTYEQRLKPEGASGAIELLGENLLVTNGESATLLNVNTGALRLTYPVQALVEGPDIDDKRAVFFTHSPVAVLDLLSASASALDARPGGCVQGETYVEFYDGRLAFRSLSEPAAPPRIETLRGAHWALRNVQSCGTYGPDRVFAVYVTEGDTVRAHIVRVGAAMEIVSDIDLGPREYEQTRISMRFPDLSGLRGTLPRFNIVALREATGSGAVFVDLETGSIQSIDLDHIELANVFRSNGRWFVWTVDQHLHVFDASTGAKTGEIAVGGGGAYNDVTPASIGRHEIWFGGIDAPRLKPAIGVLTLDLGVSYQSGMTLQKVAAQRSR